MDTFQKKYPGLVWSNPKASKEVYIRQALLKPRFKTLLMMASDFGLSALKKEWKVLSEDGDRKVSRAASEVERIFKNMETGSRLRKQNLFHN